MRRLKSPELLTHLSNTSDLSTLMKKRRRCAQGLSLCYQTQDERSCSWRKGSAHEKNDSQNVLLLNLSTKFDSAVSWVVSCTSTKCEIDRMNGDQVTDEHTDRDRDSLRYSILSLQIAQRRDLTCNATAASSSSLCLAQIHPLHLLFFFFFFFFGHPVVIKQMGWPDVRGWVEPPPCSAGAADGSVLLQQQENKKKRGKNTRDASLRSRQGCYVLVLQVFFFTIFNAVILIYR